MKKGTQAFSLTELLIVLVVIAVLFGAMAPIVTKRHIAEAHDTESIWNFVPGDSERDAYFDPGSETWTSSVYMGMVAPATANNNAGKVVIDSYRVSYNGGNPWMPQMQFRFSKNPDEQGRGLNTATLRLDGNSIHFGTSFSPYSSAYSTVYGLSNLTNNIKTYSLTVMGSGAMGNAKINAKGSTSNYQYITAIGHRALNKLGTNKSSNTVNGIYIGAGAGSGGAEIDEAPTDNVVVGYDAMAADNASGSHNVFLGAHTGNGFTSTSASYNTIVGSMFTGTTASYNTIVGYGVYKNGNSAVKAMTAIGYGSCESVEGTSGSKVCIGYNAGHSTNNTPTVFDTDDGEHIYIGGRVQATSAKGFPGRSALEVHNNTINDVTYGNVVINTNLVLRGNLYPSDENGRISFNLFTDTQSGGAETQYYRCNTDSYDSILFGKFNNYVCKGLAASNPKSVNMLIKGGNCSTTDGYTNGSGCPAISSDKRLKYDISENNDGLNKILKLKPYNYTYKSDDSTPQVGVMAQDLQKIFPNAVSKDKKGFLQIRMEDMFYALVNSVKELAQKIEDLFTKVAQGQKDLVTIKSEHKDINKQILVLDKRIRKLERK